MTRGGAPCFHCGEAIPAGTVILAHVHAKDEPVCCHGCKAVAEFISGAGLDDYYKYRDQSAARADEVPRTDRWSAYDRPDLVERLTRAEANGARSITVLLEGMRCSACSWLADKALHLQSGVLDVSVNPATARARLVWDPAKVRLAVCGPLSSAQPNVLEADPFAAAGEDSASAPSPDTVRGRPRGNQPRRFAQRDVRFGDTLRHGAGPPEWRPPGPARPARWR